MSVAYPSDSKGEGPDVTVTTGIVVPDPRLPPSDAPAPTDGDAGRSTRERRRYFDSRGRTKSQSIGRATRGFLRHAVAVEDSATIFVKPSSEDERYGTYEVVEAIEEVAARVARAFPGSRLVVGDVSQRGGGRIRPHRSHRRGLDADLGFFVTDPDGVAVATRSFVRVNDEGADVAGSGMRFDLARNWALVEALLTQTHAPVQYILVARPLEALLVARAADAGAPAELVSMASLALYQSSRGARHDNHFHVRFYCARDDRPACVDAPPFHPWFDPSRARPAPAAGEPVESKR